MAFEIGKFGDDGLDEDYLTWLVDQQAPDTAAQFGRLWDYFRNPMTPALGPGASAMNVHSRPYLQAQEAGLPARITGVNRTALDKQMPNRERKEVVIENDIAWRVHTMVDFLFGKAPTIRSLAADRRMAAAVERVVAALFDANGGSGFFQEMALLGSIHGFVDIALRTPAGGLAALAPAIPDKGPGPSGNSSPPRMPASSPPGEGGRPVIPYLPDSAIRRAIDCVRLLGLETIEAPRILPVLEEYDYRRLRFWVQRFFAHPPRLGQTRRPWLGIFGRSRSARPAAVEVVEIIGPSWWQRYEDRELVAEGPNPLGRLSVVHIQNMALGGSYAGLSDVEPLVPLQDELNTRLSDRANRVTFQSFKMFLAKGIEDFLERPVGPGQMWATHNPAASIQEFGSDDGSPSEDIHIQQVRSALDKVSAVTPLAAGLIQGNVGNLTSATALKVLLGGLLARTARKRLTYGAGIQQIVELALAWLDLTGALRTGPDDRRVEIHWPNVLPVDEGEQLRNARIKAQLGLSRERVLSELGYDLASQAND